MRTEVPQKSPLWLITGASTGLGYALSLAALALGVRVIATSRSQLTTEKLSTLTRLGGTWQPLDVTKDGDFSLHRLTGGEPVDVLVNNAGYAIGATVEDMEVEKGKEVFEANLWGIVRGVKMVVEGMRAKGGGSVVNVGSAEFWSPHVGIGAYAASKFAVEGMSPLSFFVTPAGSLLFDTGMLRCVYVFLNAEATDSRNKSGLSESLAGELSPFNVRVLIVEPGGMRTDFVDPARIAQNLAPLSKPYEGTMVEHVLKILTGMHGTQDLTPEMAARAIVDEVLQPTKSQDGKTPILRLPVGKESRDGMRKRGKELAAAVDDWESAWSKEDFSASAVP